MAGHRVSLEHLRLDLEHLLVDLDQLSTCPNLASAMALLGKARRRHLRQCHPDLGGDAEIFKILAAKYDSVITVVERQAGLFRQLAAAVAAESNRVHDDAALHFAARSAAQPAARKAAQKTRIEKARKVAKQRVRKEAKAHQAMAAAAAARRAAQQAKAKAQRLAGLAADLRAQAALAARRREQEQAQIKDRMAAVKVQAASLQDAERAKEAEEAKAMYDRVQRSVAAAAELHCVHHDAALARQRAAQSGCPHMHTPSRGQPN